MATKKPKTIITLAQAIEGHERHMQAANYSKSTISGYGMVFSMLTAAIPPTTLIYKITREDIESFMESLRKTPIEPRGITAATATKRKQRSPKTLRNYHIALSSLWSWALDREFVVEHIIHKVTAPTVHEPPIQPLTAEEVVALVKACKQSKPWRNKPLTNNTRPTYHRDRALILFLLDTGLRVSEATNALIKNVHFAKDGGKVEVLLGKGNKSRWVLFGRRTAEALNEYLITRKDNRPDNWLFTTTNEEQMPRTNAGLLIKRLAQRAGISRVVTPHLLRTTAACNMAQHLTAWQLRDVLGHSNIETTLRYVKAANLNLTEAMRRASPVDNLRL